MFAKAVLTSLACVVDPIEPFDMLAKASAGEGLTVATLPGAESKPCPIIPALPTPCAAAKFPSVAAFDALRPEVVPEAF